MRIDNAQFKNRKHEGFFKVCIGGIFVRVNNRHNRINMKKLDFRVFLDEGSAEFYLDNIWYFVEYDVYDNFCAIDKLKIYCDNEECELTLISKEELELRGIDEKFREWICDQIDYEIRWELETRFYEEYPHLVKEEGYEY